MPANATWLIENHVIYNTYYDEVTIDDFNTIASQNIRDINAIGDKVLVISDFSQATKYPLNPQVILSTVGRGLRHENLAAIAVITQNNRLMNMLSSIVLRIAHIEHGIFTDFESAYAYIRQKDPQLPESIEMG